MLESIRDFLNHRRAEVSLDIAALEGRFADYFIELGRRIADGLQSTDPREWVVRQGQEVKNLDAIVNTLKNPSPTERARAALLLDDVLSDTASLEHRQQLIATIDRQGLDASTRADVLIRHGQILRGLGLPEDALETLNRAIELGVRLQNMRIEARARLHQSRMLFEKGQTSEARRASVAFSVRASGCGDDFVKGRAHEMVGWLLMMDDKLELSRAQLENSRRCYARAGARRDEAGASAQLACALMGLREFSSAIEQFKRALDFFNALQDTPNRAKVLGNLGVLHLELGSLDEAEDYLNQAVESLTALGFRDLGAFFRLVLAELYIERGDWSCARAAIRRSSSDHQMSGEVTIFAGEVPLLEGLLLLSTGDVSAAKEAFHNTIRLCERLPRTKFVAQAMLAVTYYILGEADVARDFLDQASSVSDLPRTTELLDIVSTFAMIPAARAGDSEANRQVQDAIARLRSNDTAPVMDVSTRIAVRILARYSDSEQAPDLQMERAGSTARIDVEPSHARFTLELNGAEQWFKMTHADGECQRVDIRRRRAIRLILKRFVDRHREHPPTPLSVHDILAAGWPHQTVSYEAGLQRVYTAINRMRKLGLAEVLLTSDDGYYLDPALRVVEAA